MKEKANNIMESLNKIGISTLFGLMVLFLSAFGLVGCAEADDEGDEGEDMEDGNWEIAPENEALEVKDGSTPVVRISRALAPGLIGRTGFAELTPDGDTVASLDVDRYLGTWYEIATYEQLFQRGCTGTTATYSLNDNGTIGVKNECRVGSLDGRYKSAQAYAKVVDKDSNAKLKVYFFSLFGAPYWVIELDGQDGDAPYEWAVVGSSTDRYLWILSRTPQISDRRLNLILDRLEQRGYDLDKLSFTLQADE